MPPKHPRSCLLSEIMDYILMNVTQMQYISGSMAPREQGNRLLQDPLCSFASNQVSRSPDSFSSGMIPLEIQSNQSLHTLVHQLIRYIPDLEHIIVSKIQSDSLIFTKSLASQFDCLIFGPLQQLQPDLFSGQTNCSSDRWSRRMRWGRKPKSILLQ